MITINAVPAEKVRSMWAWVHPALVQITTECDDRWIPEDIWLALQMKSSFLYTFELNQEPVGFFVARNFADVDGNALFIWCLWAEPGSMKQGDSFQETLYALEGLARSIGAKRIRHYSPRKGWIVNGMFEEKMFIYEREIL